MKIRILFLGSVLSLPSHAGNVQAPPPPPPFPWYVNAYIGLERDPHLSAEPETKSWLWQNSLQFSDGKLLLHRQIVSCTDGKLFSVEGDGGAEFYEATLTDQQTRNLRFLYLGCDNCLRGSAQPNLVLRFERLSPTVVRLGGVTYSSQVKPYTERCSVGT